jgi:hypothetical protein
MATHSDKQSLANRSENAALAGSPQATDFPAFFP